MSFDNEKFNQSNQNDNLGEANNDNNVNNPDVSDNSQSKQTTQFVFNNQTEGQANSEQQLGSQPTGSQPTGSQPNGSQPNGSQPNEQHPNNQSTQPNQTNNINYNNPYNYGQNGQNQTSYNYNNQPNQDNQAEQPNTNFNQNGSAQYNYSQNNANQNQTEYTNQAVWGDSNQYHQNQQYNPNNQGQYYYNPQNNYAKPPKKKKEKKPMGGRQVAVIAVVACIVSSLLFGFGGTILANSLGLIKYDNSGSAVFYQSISRTNPDGSEINGNLPVSKIAEIATPSVVEITTERVATGSFLQQYITTGAGSGVILSKDGYIVTNNHVIAQSNKIMVRTKDGKSFEAKLIGTDQQTDIAVIKIDANDLIPAVLGDSSTLAVGQMTVAVGNPLGQLGGTVTDGIISALDREINVEGESMTLLQTNTAINPGNSGGGLFNGKGELIGIVNAKSSGNDIEGLGFAIPINQVKTVTENIIEHGYVKGRVVMGISVINITDMQMAMQYRVNQLGLYVAKVNQASPAEKAGMKVGDCIEEVEGTKVMTSAELNKVLNKATVGQTINIKVKRGLEDVELSLVLDEYKPQQ